MARILACVIFLFAAAGSAQPPPYPLNRPDPLPPFHVPRAGSTLDDGWQYSQTIIDAAAGHPENYNAYPVQVAFTHGGRAFVATLHTVFSSLDGGHSWRNLDPNPPPFTNSPFAVLRAPIYVTGLTERPVARTAIDWDSLYISALNANNNSGRVDLLYFAAAAPYYFLLPDNVHFFVSPHWLTGITVPDSNHALAFAGYDRLVYVRDSLDFPEITRWDSIYTTQGDHWVAGPPARVNQKIVVAGSEHWTSDDAGATWSTSAAADSQGDAGVSFCDTLHGLTGGGILNPSPSGWVHRTTNGGVDWSARTLNSAYPIRCVDLVTPDIGFAAGGNYLTGNGVIWKTTDGGQNWTLDATMDAEITAIESRRASGAYVDVIAAGVFPDFRGGIWVNRLYLPDLSGPVLVAEPDTVDFGVVARGDTGTVLVTVQNVGQASALLSGIEATQSAFAVAENVSGYAIQPGAQVQLHVRFTPPFGDTTTVYSGVVMVLSADGHTDLVVGGAVPLVAGERGKELPQSATLNVWPNPGNAVFQIRFELARASDATMSIYDLSGRQVASLTRGVHAAGEHVISWNAGNVASGIYFVRLETSGSQIIHKLMLLK